jgi:hypothetical protein
MAVSVMSAAQPPIGWRLAAAGDMRSWHLTALSRPELEQVASESMYQTKYTKIIQQKHNTNIKLIKSVI